MFLNRKKAGREERRKKRGTKSERRRMRKSPYGLLNEIGVQVRHLYDTRDDTATESKGHDP